MFNGVAIHTQHIALLCLFLKSFDSYAMSEAFRYLKRFLPLISMMKGQRTHIGIATLLACLLTYMLQDFNLHSQLIGPVFLSTFFCYALCYFWLALSVVCRLTTRTIRFVVPLSFDNLTIERGCLFANITSCTHFVFVTHNGVAYTVNTPQS